MKKMIRKHPVILAVIFIVSLVLVTYIPLSFPFNGILVRLILCAILIFYLYKNDMLNILSFNLSRFKHGLVSGILFFLFAIWVTALNIYALSRDGELHFSIAFWTFCLQMIMIGVFEELCFRGLFINMYIKHHEKVKNTIYKAVLVSSAVFGLCHYINLIDQPIIMTTAQVYGAFCLGVLFAAVYLKGLNVWVCAFFHALWNFGNMCPFYQPGKNVEMYGITTEMSLSHFAFELIEPTIFLIIGVFILRNIHKEKYLTAIFAVSK